MIRKPKTRIIVDGDEKIVYAECPKCGNLIKAEFFVSEDVKGVRISSYLECPKCGCRMLFSDLLAL